MLNNIHGHTSTHHTSHRAVLAVEKLKERDLISINNYLYIINLMCHVMLKTIYLKKKLRNTLKYHIMDRNDCSALNPQSIRAVVWLMNVLSCNYQQWLLMTRKSANVRRSRWDFRCSGSEMSSPASPLETKSEILKPQFGKRRSRENISQKRILSPQLSALSTKIQSNLASQMETRNWKRTRSLSVNYFRILNSEYLLVVAGKSHSYRIT